MRLILVLSLSLAHSMYAQDKIKPTLNIKDKVRLSQLTATKKDAPKSTRELEIRANGGELNEDEQPKKTIFRWKDLKAGRALVAGRVYAVSSFGRKLITFYTFDGYQVVAERTNRPDLDQELMEKLKKGESLPITMIVNLEDKTIVTNKGSRTFPQVEYIYSYKVESTEELCEVAIKKGFNKGDCDKFKKHFVEK